MNQINSKSKLQNELLKLQRDVSSLKSSVAKLNIAKMAPKVIKCERRLMAHISQMAVITEVFRHITRNSGYDALAITSCMLIASVEEPDDFWFAPERTVLGWVNLFADRASLSV